MFLIPTGEVRKCDDLTRDEFSFRVRGKTPLDSSENDSFRLSVRWDRVPAREARLQR